MTGAEIAWLVVSALVFFGLALAVAAASVVVPLALAAAKAAFVARAVRTLLNRAERGRGGTPCRRPGKDAVITDAQRGEYMLQASDWARVRLAESPGCVILDSETTGLTGVKRHPLPMGDHTASGDARAAMNLIRSIAEQTAVSPARENARPKVRITKGRRS